MFSGIFPFILFLLYFWALSFFDSCPSTINSQTRKSILIYSWILLALFAGCRWSDADLNSLGIFDYGAYKHVYDNSLDISNFYIEYLLSDNYVKSMDVGYVFLSSFFRNYTAISPNLFFLLINCLSIVLLYKGFKRNKISSIPFLIISIYACRLYFQYNFIMMRQALAMAIVWYSIPYIINRKIWKFILSCIVAALLHFSAIFFLSVIFFRKNIFPSSKSIICIFSILFLLGFLGITDSFINLIIQNFTNILGLNARFSFYMEADAYKRGINLLNFVEILPFIYLALQYRNNLHQSKYGLLFFNMLIFYTVFLLLTMNFSALTRISSYFIYSYFFILSFCWKYIRARDKVIFGSVLSSYFLIYGIRFALANFKDIIYSPFFLQL